MGNKIKKLMAFAITGAMFVAMLAIPASAATSYTPASVGTNPSFDKYLIIDENANVPNIDFAYSIAAGTAGSYGDFDVFAGNDASRTNGVLPKLDTTQGASNPQNGTISFTSADTAASSVASGDDLTLSSGEKYAKHSLTVDFTGVTYGQPGIYRYIITETSSGQQGVSYDTQADTAGQKTRVLDVYVIDNNGTLAVDSCVLHEGTAFADEDDDDVVDDKSKGFVNEYATQDITFSKTVSGNQASHEKYFKFTLSVANAGAGTVLDVVGAGSTFDAAPTQNSSTTYTTATMASNTISGNKLTCDNTGAVTHDFYLQHGQSVTVNGLPAGATYEIVEVPEDYTSNYDADDDTVDGTIASDDVTAAFTNTKSGTIPTGIIFPILGGMALVGGAGAGLAANRRRHEEEE